MVTLAAEFSVQAALIDGRFHDSLSFLQNMSCVRSMFRDVLYLVGTDGVGV